MGFNGRMKYAFEKRAEKELNKLLNSVDESYNVPAIYLGTRTGDEGELRGYIGQTKNIKRRYGEYLMIKAGKTFGNRHFELSLQAHKDWKLTQVWECNESDLDECEKHKIAYYSKIALNRYNIQSGGNNENGNLLNNSVKQFGVLKEHWKSKCEFHEKQLREIRDYCKLVMKELEKGNKQLIKNKLPPRMGENKEKYLKKIIELTKQKLT